MREVRPAAARFRTVGDGTRTFHSFSYGTHYDPDNIGFGALRAINVEHVEPAAGYDTHHHADVEIVTWVLEGTLRHDDTTGAGGDIRPRVAQRLSAGTGVEHAERNASATEPLVFVQCMLASTWEADPDYAQTDVPVEPGALVPTVGLRSEVELLVADLDGRPLTVPAAPRRLVHVTRGTVLAEGLRLDQGAEIRTDDADDLVLTSDGPAEALVWLLHT